MSKGEKQTKNKKTMKHLLLLFSAWLVGTLPLLAEDQDTKRTFTLAEAILQAQKASPDAQAARHTYR